MTRPYLDVEQIKHILDICQDDDIKQALEELGRANNVCTAPAPGGG